MKTKENSNVIEAAGGLVWRHAASAREIAVVHRARYDDWTLPKGKLKKGESWEAAAIREVREETGCFVELDSYAGSVSYLVDEHPKIVLYWHMRLLDEGEFTPSDEVDQLAWLNITDAMARVSYSGEKALLESLIGEPL